MITDGSYSHGIDMIHGCKVQYFDDARFSPQNAAFSRFSSTIVVHWVHRASRRTQSDTALHKKNPETVPWL